MASVVLSNLVRNAGRKRWVAKLRIPEDVRKSFGGKAVLTRSTGEEDPLRAAIKAKPILAEWRAQIEAARRGGHTPMQARVVKLRAEYRAALRDRPGDAQELLEEAIEAIFRDIAPDISDAAEARATAAYPFDRGSAIASLVPEIGEIIEDVRDGQTPFLEHVDAWAAQLRTRTQKQSDEYLRDVRAFGANRFLETLTGREVQTWIDGRLASGDKVATVRRRMSALRGYWAFLGRQEHVRQDGSPFDGRHYPRQTGDGEGARESFTAAEVSALYRQALADRDTALADLIWLGAHTGARIEELCVLEVSSVTVDAAGLPTAISIRDSKTKASRRDVPVHSAVGSLVRKLIEEAQGGRWLIHSAAANKYGKRSTGPGKRFGRLKATLGHGEGLVFHSIRKTVATLLQNANCPESVAADLLGHKIPTMTYGLYATGTTMKVKQRWIERITYPAGP